METPSESNGLMWVDDSRPPRRRSTLTDIGEEARRLAEDFRAHGVFCPFVNVLFATCGSETPQEILDTYLASLTILRISHNLPALIERYGAKCRELKFHDGLNPVARRIIYHNENLYGHHWTLPSTAIDGALLDYIVEEAGLYERAWRLFRDTWEVTRDDGARYWMLRAEEERAPRENLKAWLIERLSPGEAADCNN
jgi:hypothetical protein